MKVIVEGPDGSGKTTLIQLLLAQPDLELELMPRSSSSTGGPVKDLAKWVEHDLGRFGPSYRALYDRYPLISELIYGPLLRGYLPDKFTNPHWMQQQWRKLCSNPVLIIYCLPPLARVREAILSDPANQLEGVAQRIETMYWLYYAAMVKSPTTITWVWNWCQPDLDALAFRIKYDC